MLVPVHPLAQAVPSASTGRRSGLPPTAERLPPRGKEPARLQPLVKRSSRPKVLHFAAGTVATTLDDGDYRSGFHGGQDTGLNFLLPVTVRSGRVEGVLCVEGRFVWTQARLDAELARGARVVLSRRFGFSALRS